MARLASEAEVPITIVAVGNRNRGVLAPCDRCRQAMFDYYPDVSVVVVDGDQNQLKSLKELLPYTYSWNEQQIIDE